METKKPGFSKINSVKLYLKFELANLYLMLQFRPRNFVVCTLIKLAWALRRYFDELASLIEKPAIQKNEMYLRQALTLLKQQLPAGVRDEFLFFILEKRDYPYHFSDRMKSDIWHTITSISENGTFSEMVVLQNLVIEVISSIERTLEKVETEGFLSEVWDYYRRSEPSLSSIESNCDYSYVFIQFLIDKLSFERIERDWTISRNKIQFDLMEREKDV